MSGNNNFKKPKNFYKKSSKNFENESFYAKELTSLIKKLGKM